MPNHVDLSALIQFHYIASRKLIMLPFWDGKLRDTIGVNRALLLPSLALKGKNADGKRLNMTPTWAEHVVGITYSLDQLDRIGDGS